jgi:hypothetical protein
MTQLLQYLLRVISLFKPYQLDVVMTSTATEPTFAPPMDAEPDDTVNEFCREVDQLHSWLVSRLNNLNQKLGYGPIGVSCLGSVETKLQVCEALAQEIELLEKQVAQYHPKTQESRFQTVAARTGYPGRSDHSPTPSAKGTIS